ncbi:MAG: hypothetical protein IT365_17145 [Candidatus Hydrogenedentes bacterium]|nr:hypothetical protein [Candidatus Hydrogenedentota bacterium]
MNITEAQNNAAGEFVDLIANRVSSGGRAVHPETAISSTARVAGSLLLRSFNLRIESVEPGTAVLSNEANEKGPQLIGMMAAFLSNAGVQLDKSLMGGEKAQRDAEPELSTLQTLSLLQTDALSIANRNGLSLEQAAQSAALATAFIVKECARNIPAETGFNVAAFGIIEGSKTAPPPITQDAPASGKKPWYKLW